MTRKARELPGHLQHLPAYQKPDPSRVTHSAIWRRAMARWKPGTRVTVQPRERTRMEFAYGFGFGCALMLAVFGVLLLLDRS